MRKLAILVALASTSLATSAYARDGAWYVGVEGGGMIVEDVDFDITNSLGVETKDAASLDHRYGFDVDGIIGYDFGMFRLEGEVGYKRAEVDAIQQNAGPLPICSPPTCTSGVGPGETNYNPGPTGPGVPFTWEGAKGSTRALSFMVNGLLDFGNDDGISGFVGGGAGIARVEVDRIRVAENASRFVTDSDSKFAWQVIAGVRTALSQNVDLGLKYRFFNVEDLKLASFYSSGIETRFRSHSLLASLIYNFGEPAAPPPPPPEPPVTVAPGPFIVFFDWDKSAITPEAASILDNAAAAYAQTGQAQVMLAGHADKSGSDQYNVALSQRRADATKSYLAGKGVPETAISTEAFGESRPLVETADGVREPQNRRVEITFGPGSGM